MCCEGPVYFIFSQFNTQICNNDEGFAYEVGGVFIKIKGGGGINDSFIILFVRN